MPAQMAGPAGAPTRRPRSHATARAPLVALKLAEWLQPAALQGPRGSSAACQQLLGVAASALRGSSTHLEAKAPEHVAMPSPPHRIRLRVCTPWLPCQKGCMRGAETACARARQSPSCGRCSSGACGSRRWPVLRCSLEPAQQAARVGAMAAAPAAAAAPAPAPGIAAVSACSDALRETWLALGAPAACRQRAPQRLRAA